VRGSPATGPPPTAGRSGSPLGPGAGRGCLRGDPRSLRARPRPAGGRCGWRGAREARIGSRGGIPSPRRALNRSARAARRPRPPAPARPGFPPPCPPTAPEVVADRAGLQAEADLPASPGPSGTLFQATAWHVLCCHVTPRPGVSGGSRMQQLIRLVAAVFATLLAPALVLAQS